MVLFHSRWREHRFINTVLYSNRSVATPFLIKTRNGNATASPTKSTICVECHLASRRMDAKCAAVTAMAAHTPFVCTMSQSVYRGCINRKLIDTLESKPLTQQFSRLFTMVSKDVAVGESKCLKSN